MSDPALTPPDEQTPDEQVREFGRQLAADSILKAAMQVSETSTHTEPIRGSTASGAPTSRPMAFAWWKVGSLAAGLLVAGVTVVLVMETWMTGAAPENVDPVQSQQIHDSANPGGAFGKSHESQLNDVRSHQELQKESPGRQPETSPNNLEPEVR